MSFYASANGIRVTSLSLSIAYYGIPVADVTLSDAVTLTAPIVLTVGNLSLTMAPFRQRSFAGNATGRLVGGAGGWGLPLTLAPYQNAAGVPLSLVLRDASAAVGETVSLGTDRSVGAFYVPAVDAPAELVLRHLAGATWYVDPAGVTQVRARPGSVVTSAATVADYKGGAGWLEVATEDPAAWMPGAVFSGVTVPTPITVAATRIRSGDDGVMRLEVLTT